MMEDRTRPFVGPLFHKNIHSSGRHTQKNKNIYGTICSYKRPIDSDAYTLWVNLKYLLCYDNDDDNDDDDEY